MMKILKLLKTRGIVEDFEVLDFKKFTNGFYIKVEVKLDNNDRLFVREYSDEEERNYSYHWQTKKEELEKGWSTLFYKHVFTEIDEENFSKMYSDKPSRPNFPVNILIGLEILKHIFNLTESQRTLYEFRNRLTKHLKEQPNLITDLLVNKLSKNRYCFFKQSL